MRSGSNRASDSGPDPAGLFENSEGGVRAGGWCVGRCARVGARAVRFRERVEWDRTEAGQTDRRTGSTPPVQTKTRPDQRRDEPGLKEKPGARQMLRLLLQPAARWLHRIQFEMERRANEWRSSARVSDGHEAAAHAAHAAHAGRLLMQVRDWAALTCLFVVKPNACQRPPQSQARIRPGAGVEPKGGVPVLESLQHPAWRAADPARGLAAADAACAGVPIRRRGKGPTWRRGAPGSCSRRERRAQRQRIIAWLASPPRGMGPGRVKWFHSPLLASGRWR